MWTRRLAIAETAATVLWLLGVIATHSDAGVPFLPWMLLFAGFTVLAVWWVVRGAIVFIRPRPWASRRAWLRGPAMLLVGLLVANSAWLLDVRLAASAPALLRRASELETIPTSTLHSHPRWVGLFRVREFTRFGEELRFLTNDCGLADQCGVVYSRAGQPSHRGEDSYTHLYGPWWHWYQSW